MARAMENEQSVAALFGDADVLLGRRPLMIAASRRGAAVSGDAMVLLRAAGKLRKTALAVAVVGCVTDARSACCIMIRSTE